jgi:tRNA G10  N-methylase Trm11
MNKFFIFGNHPDISLAELISISDCQEGQLFNNNILAVNLPFKIEPASFINKLGGTVKLGEIIAIIPKKDKNLVQKIIKDEVFNIAQNIEGKFNFGLSDYSSQILPPNFGLNLKKELKKNNINSRLVVSKEKVLSSVVVWQNKLLKKGVEIIISANNDYILLGKTEAVQNFKDLSRRDYGRPARDDLSGMLPPKLARIMINLAGPNDPYFKILDPFCGSGTILSEAILSGYKNIIGADISAKAINDSKANLNWTRDLYNIDQVNSRFINRSVSNLSKVIKEKSIDLIITEPYLGPQRGLNDIKQIKKELESLYEQALFVFHKISKKDALVIMIWPVFFTNNFLEINHKDWEIINPISSYWQKIMNIENKKRPSLIYGRPGQKVWREIVLLKKLSS